MTAKRKNRTFREPTMTLYMPHRRELAEAMAEVQPCTTEAELLKIITSSGLAVALISVTPYGFDERIGWDTYLVQARWVDGSVSPIGYTNGALPE